MKFTADIHIHSHYSRGTSNALTPENLHLWAAYKGISLLGTGDFTHPKWREELKEKLEPVEDGVFRLREKFLQSMETNNIKWVDLCDIRFILSAEISCIYKRHGRTRRVHNVVLMPDFESADKLSKWLSSIGNIEADGRPILKLDSYALLLKSLEICERALFIPAHIWTPHYSVFGSQSGFDSLEEAFSDLLPHIHAIETGLSSNPPMNWRVPELDHVAVISSSDAHSLQKLGRELTLFDTDMTYSSVHSAFSDLDSNRFEGTIEFFPEEGKYHYDGHRNCNVSWEPKQTKVADGICPVCGRKVTVGVLHRVEELAKREEGEKPATAREFKSMVSLHEIIANVTGRGNSTHTVTKKYFDMLRNLGAELYILQEVPLEDIVSVAGEKYAQAISNVRNGNVKVIPGYDGEYGKIHVL
jgi:uncharacterized protein (TIGR00375 family)